MNEGILKVLVLTVIRNDREDNKTLKSIHINKLITTIYYFSNIDAKINIVSYFFTEKLYLYCCSHFDVIALDLTHTFHFNTAIIDMKTLVNLVQSENSKKLTKNIFCAFISLVKDPCEYEKKCGEKKFHLKRP